MEKSDPRARSDTERPVSWLPAPGLETTSTIKVVGVSGRRPPPIFRPEPASAQGYQWLGRLRLGFPEQRLCRSSPAACLMIDRDCPWITARGHVRDLGVRDGTVMIGG
jgi:hypothetical protein